MSILMTSINNILSFLTGTVLPIPALRSFCTQVWDLGIWVLTFT
jgi:patched 1 protein